MPSVKGLPDLPASAVVASGRLFAMGIEFVTMLYLMRELGPQPFGLVAMAMALIVILRILQDGGAGAFLVSDSGLHARRVGAALVVSLGVSVAATLVALACTPLIAKFYHDGRVAQIWIVISLSIVFSGVASVPVSIAQKQQRFLLVAWIPALVTLVAAMAAIALSFGRHDFWPIVAYHVTVSVLSLAFFWLAVRPRLSLPGKEDVRDVVRFGKGLITFEFLNVLNRNADNILIGKFLGSEALGQYGLAYRMLSLPVRRIGSIMSALAFPRLSGLAPDWRAVSRGLAEVMREVSLFVTPICIGIALSARELILVTVGHAWLGALVPLQIFALLGIYQAPFSLQGMAYLISKNTARMAKWAFISTPVILLSFVAGLPWGIVGVASAYAIASLALFWPMMSMASSVLNVAPGLLIRGGMAGIGGGLLLSIPLVAAYFATSLSGCSAMVILSATIGVGAVTEAVLYVRVIRRRRKKGSTW